MPVGGAEDLAELLASSLKKENVETEFVCLRDPGALGEELIRKGCQMHLLEVSKSKRFSLFGCLRFSRWLKKNRIDVVHSHTYHAHVYSFPAAAFAGIPVILHHHKTLEKMKWRKRVIFQWCLRRAAAVVALSQKTATDLVHTFRLPEKKVFALPNAVDPVVFHPATPAEHRELRIEQGLPADAFLLGTVASLQKVKNHALVIKALAQTPGQVHAVFLGEGPELAELEALATSLGVRDRVLFAGRQRPVAPWLRALDLFVFPSFWEGQSLALLQALACGIPVLASDIEGNTALLGPEYPGLFQPGDPETLRKLLQDCLADESFRHGLVKAASAQPRKTLPELCRDMLEVYQFALGPERNPTI